MTMASDLNGLALLHDWLGEGGEPVHEMVSEFRAQRCLSGDNGKPCPMNKEPNWWERHIKDPIAEIIREQLELRTGMGLKVKGEEDLHMCGACGCCLKLKVHAPIVHIRNHTSRKEMAKFVPFCWILKELHV